MELVGHGFLGHFMYNSCMYMARTGWIGAQSMVHKNQKHTGTMVLIEERGGEKGVDAYINIVGLCVPGCQQRQQTTTRRRIR